MNAMNDLQLLDKFNSSLDTLDPAEEQILWQIERKLKRSEEKRTDFDGIYHLSYRITCDQEKIIDFCLKSNEIPSDTTLPDNSLLTIPPEIGQLTALHHLSFYYCQVADLPESLANLPRLGMLILTGNRFTALPPVVCKIPSLVTLYAGENQMTALPEEIGNLPHLRDLRLSLNALSRLPDGLCRCTQLKELHLDNNQLHTFPAVFGNLTALKILNFDYNQVNTFPESCRRWTNLQLLSARYNRFETLPDWVRAWEKLETLVLTGNPLGPLGSLPSGLADLPLISNFKVDSHRFPSPWCDIITQPSQFLEPWSVPHDFVSGLPFSMRIRRFNRWTPNRILIKLRRNEDPNEYDRSHPRLALNLHWLEAQVHALHTPAACRFAACLETHFQVQIDVDAKVLL